jgi:hypothetical protein
MDGYVEFYVSCNPPLLPIGVSSVIEDAMNDLGQVCTAKEALSSLLTYLRVYHFLDCHRGPVRA